MPVPRVTVLLAVCNGEPHLGDSIRSILGQTLRDLELLVVDDASSDGSAATLASFRDPRLRVVRNEENLGLTRSLNRGLALTGSEYVARLDADDLSFPERLERQVAFLDANPEVGVVGAQGIPIDVRGRRLSRVGWWHREWRRPAGGAAFDWYRMFDTPFIHSSVMFRRALVRDELGGYDESFLLSQDAELWMRAARRTRMANLDAPLVAMRIRPSSLTADPARRKERGTREQKIAILRAAMTDVLRDSDVPMRIAETWIDVNDAAAAVSPQAIRVLRDDVDSLAARFPRERAIRRHRASMLARMIEKAAPGSRGLALALLAGLVRLDPTGALLLLPRVVLRLLFGDLPFRWRRAVWRRRTA
ncbi:MAG TPA: glycosyltransferase [Thermoanaerobaculia bacterium]|nr:glycosyltransferase [Thermoanaerobaculia bacterium]